jgi:glycosyltransferase involved in cell wall biosynthesis
VDDGRTGLLVPPGDPAALADAIVRVLLDPALARGLGQAAHEAYLRRFAREPVMRQMLEVYDRVLTPASASTP